MPVPTAENFVSGVNASLLYGAADPPATEAFARNVNFSETAGRIDVTNTGGSGFQQNARSVKRGTLTFQLVSKVGSAATLFVAGTFLYFKATYDGDKTITGRFYLETVNRQSAVAGDYTIDVTAHSDGEYTIAADAAGP